MAVIRGKLRERQATTEIICLFKNMDELTFQEVAMKAKQAGKYPQAVYKEFEGSIKDELI